LPVASATPQSRRSAKGGVAISFERNVFRYTIDPLCTEDFFPILLGKGDVNPVEEGKAKNDYTNAFLNHFGFCDYPRSASVSADERKYRKTGSIKMASNNV